MIALVLSPRYIFRQTVRHGGSSRMNDIQPQPPQPPGPVRDWIAISITAGSILLLLLLAITAIVINKDPKDVLTILLPVIGTWVGTVLAFYFGKENLDAATRSVATMARLTASDKLKQILATDKMITKDRMFFKRTPESSIKLLETLDELEQQKKGDRIPVLDPQDRPVYVVHRSTIDQYLTTQARQPTPPDLKILTLQDLLSDSKLKDKLENSFITLNENATLQDVKAAMDAAPDAQDAFLTRNGKSNEPILGWITNNIIADNSRV
jgi:hypothetical protein